jgi:hypothetical protein
MEAVMAELGDASATEVWQTLGDLSTFVDGSWNFDTSGAETMLREEGYGDGTIDAYLKIMEMRMNAQ